MNSSIAKALVVAIAGLTGLLLLVFPDQAAASLGLPGTDEFAYRSGGAAFMGYALAMIYGWQAGTGPMRILWLATYAAALSVLVVCGLSVLNGATSGGTLLVMLVGALVVAAVSGLAVVNPRPILPAPTSRQFSTWFVAFLGWGVIASALFGLGGLLLGSTFGKLFGFPGGDDLVYRLAGAATVGILVGSVLAIRSQDWELVRLPVLMSFATNVLTLVGGLIYISQGGVPITAFLIAGAAIFNIVGLGLALSGRR